MNTTQKSRLAITKKIVTRLRQGAYTVTAICEAVGIDRSTYYRWEKDHEDFRLAITLAKDYYRSQKLKKANKGLDKLLTGYTFSERTYEFSYIRDSEGNETQDFRLSKQVDKAVAPNVNAIMFALRNLDPESYPETSRQELTGKDGKDLIPENLPWFDNEEPNEPGA